MRCEKVRPAVVPCSFARGAIYAAHVKIKNICTDTTGRVHPYMTNMMRCRLKARINDRFIREYTEPVHLGIAHQILKAKAW